MQAHVRGVGEVVSRQPSKLPSPVRIRYAALFTVDILLLKFGKSEAAWSWSDGAASRFQLREEALRNVS